MARHRLVTMCLTAAVAVSMACSSGVAQDKGGDPPAKPPQQQEQNQQTQEQAQWAPQWQTGQQWQVQSQTYQMQAMGEPTWLPPVQWQYQVTGQQQVGQVPCQVVQVSQQGQQRPVMRLFVSTRDLNLVQVETAITVGGQEQIVSQQFTQGQVPGLYQLGPAPCQLPQAQTQLPPPPPQGQKAMATSKSYKAQVPAGGGIAFETEVTETVEGIDAEAYKALLPPSVAGLRAMRPEGEKLYKVTLEAAGSKSMQVIGTASPWPLYSETATQKSWLLPSPGQ